MNDMRENYEMSGEDSAFILTALEALKEDLADLLTNEETRENAQWYLGLADSAELKLQNGETQFSEDECRAMYIAGLEMRDLMNKILDDKKSSEFDREMARSTLSSANGMLRGLRKTFNENGIDISDLS